MEELRCKKLCFKCKERWDKNHQCKSYNRIQRGGTRREKGRRGSKPLVAIPETKEDAPEASFHSITNPFKPNAMRVFGTINGQKVLILLDSGATNNFLNTEAAKLCKVQLEPSTPQTIIVGNGARISSTHEGKDIEVVI
ncbi:hypothetical protein EJ110_NYTH33429 [Nymphaea thermarum]|nr:hypothetical protein EJ110_NYTH33429 [Nymphaea thermarum]